MASRKTIRPVSVDMAALEPPGNVAAELALYRGRLFAALAEPSARAWPEVIPLAFATEGHADLAPGSRERRRLEALLRQAWRGIEGGFSSTRPFLREGSLYLGFDGPLAALADSLAEGLPEYGRGSAADAAPLAARIGVFLCRPRDVERGLEAALGLGPPASAFAACRLSILRAEHGGEPLSATAWRELAAAWRPRSSRPGD